MEKFEFKKSLGQNFIQDENIIQKMLEGLELDKDTLVIEIGPGAGILSNQIVKKAGYAILYEIDTSLKPILNKKLQNYDNYKIIFNDILKENLKEELNNYDYKKIFVVANLPYYITTPIINKLIECRDKIDKIVIMIQKEVADRITSLPGNKNYGELTVHLNTYFNLEKLFNVDKTKFYPVPNVDSSVVLMSKNDNYKRIKNIDYFNQLIKDSFQFKRKNLRNNLKQYDLNKIKLILEKYNLNLSSRAEELSLDVFIELSNRLNT